MSTCRVFIPSWTSRPRSFRLERLIETRLDATEREETEEEVGWRSLGCDSDRGASREQKKSFANWLWLKFEVKQQLFWSFFYALTGLMTTKANVSAEGFCCCFWVVAVEQKRRMAEKKVFFKSLDFDFLLFCVVQHGSTSFPTCSMMCCSLNSL